MNGKLAAPLVVALLSTNLIVGLAGSQTATPSGSSIGSQPLGSLHFAEQPEVLAQRLAIVFARSGAHIVYPRAFNYVVAHALIFLLGQLPSEISRQLTNSMSTDAFAGLLATRMAAQNLRVVPGDPAGMSDLALKIAVEVVDALALERFGTDDRIRQVIKDHAVPGWQAATHRYPQALLSEITLLAGNLWKIQASARAWAEEKRAAQQSEQVRLGMLGAGRDSLSGARVIASGSDVKAFAQAPARLVQVDACILYKCGERYRAKKQLTVFAAPDPASSRVGLAPQGFEFDPLTAAYVTAKPDVLRARERWAPEGNTAYWFEKGDRIYLYTYWGEGCYTIWTRGYLYGHFEEGQRPGGNHVLMKNLISCVMVNPEFSFLERMEQGASALWIKLKLSDGRTGWVKEDTDNLESI